MRNNLSWLLNYFVCPSVGSLEHLFTFYLFFTESQLLSQNLQENVMFRQNNKAVESVWAGPAGRGIQPQGGERNHPRPRLYHFTQVLHSYIYLSIYLFIDLFYACLPYYLLFSLVNSSSSLPLSCFPYLSINIPSSLVIDLFSFVLSSLFLSIIIHSN